MLIYYYNPADILPIRLGGGGGGYQYNVEESVVILVKGEQIGMELTV